MIKKVGYILVILLMSVSCKINYSFSGVNVSKEIHTFQVNYIPNNASYVVPGLSEDFRNQLIDRINRQTSLTESDKGDIIFEAEFTQYITQPIAATAQQTAGENQLKVGLRLEYTNTKKDTDDFSKTYSFTYNYPANVSLDDIRESAHKDIFEKMLDAIFSDTLAKW